MSKLKIFLLSLVFIFVPLYPKFPLLDVTLSPVYVRLDDLVMAILGLVLALDLFRTKFATFRHPVSRAVIIFLIVGFLATFSGIFLTKTATLTDGLLHAFRRVEYTLLFFAAFSFLNSIAQLKFLTKTILVVSLIVALYGLGQIYLGLPVISTTNSEFAKGLALTLGPGARINSTFAGHYDLAAYSVFPLLLILALLPQSKHKISLLIIGGLIYWTLLLSASRITFVSFFAGATLLLFFIRKKLWLFPLGIIAILGVALSPQLRGRYLELITNYFTQNIVPIVSAQTISPVSTVSTSPAPKNVDTLPDALQAPAQPEDRSFSIRFNAEWPRALRSIEKNPILGTGYSSVGLAIDNDYLRIAAEIGTLGLLAFGLIFLLFFKSSWPFLYHYQPNFGYAFIAAVTCTVFSVLINSLFIDVFAASKIAIICWGAIGLGTKTKLLIQNEK